LTLVELVVASDATEKEHRWPVSDLRRSENLGRAMRSAGQQKG